LLTDIRHRLRALFARDSVERELHDELSFHVDRATEKYERQGMTREAAARRAHLEFGGVEQTKEAARDTRGTALLESIGRDLRYAVRSLSSRPAFTLTVVATLALGIGANTAIFSLVDALLLRPLPVAHPEQLVTLTSPWDLGDDNVGLPITGLVSFPLYRDVRARNTVLTDVYATGAAGSLDVQMSAGTAGADATAEQPDVRFVTGNFFTVLGVAPYLGRTFTAAEDQTPGQDPVAVLSYDYWQRRFSGSRAAIGSVMRVNDIAVTIIGITPPGFRGDVVGEPLDFWLPMMMQPIINSASLPLETRGWSWLSMMGRLKPGITLDPARQEVTALEANAIRAHLAGRDLTEFEQNLEDDPIPVVSGARGFSEQRAQYGKALLVLMAAVGLVILVVCANVSSLMLARTVARRREMTVRMTLGAGRGRLIQQMLAEGALLAVVSSVLGVLAAIWGTRVLLTSVGASTPIAIDTAPDTRVLAFTAALTVLCVLLFGLLPALRATRVDLATSLRSQGRNLMGGARVGSGRIPFGRALVVAQIGLSMLLLIGGGLLVRSMQELLHGDIGLDRDHIVAVRVRTARSPYVGARLGQLRRDLAARVGQIPGVDAVAFADHGIFSGGASGYDVDVSGFIPQADSERRVSLDRVGPSFVHAIGGHLIRGRDIEARDFDPGPPAVVINETMAKRYFGARDPIGATVTTSNVHYTVVGVVRDFESSNVRGKARREMYIVFSNPTVGNTGQAKLVVHVRGNPALFVGPIRRAVQGVDATLPAAVDPVNALVRGTVSEDVLLVQVTMFFCLATLVLAALGLYGVTAYATSQRTSEFGLRAALGAEPGDVTRMVLGEAVRVAAIGIVLGVPAGLAATRLIRSQLFGVGAVDLPSLSIAIAVLVLTAVVASYLPARRAAKVGPLEALRLE